MSDEQEWNLSDEDWAKNPRVFAAIVVAYTHKKDAERGALPRAGVLVNKKRFVPNKLLRWEGRIGLFGGAVAEGEALRFAVKREMGEGLPGVDQLIDIDALPERLGSHAAWIFSGSYPRPTKAPLGYFTEDDFREIAGVCREGVADVLFAAEIEALGPEAFAYPELRDYLLGLLVDTQEEIEAMWGAK